MKKVNSTKKTSKSKKNSKVEYIYIEDRTFTVKTAPSGNKYIQASFGNKPDGTPLRKKITAPTRQELEQAIKDYMDVLDGKSGANLTYYNACLQYIERRSALANATKVNYTDITNNRFKGLHDKPIMKLTKQDFFEAVTADAESGITRSTMHTALTFMSMVCVEFEVPTMTQKLKRELQKYGTTATKENKSRKSREDWDNAPSAVDIAKWAGEDTASTATRTAISILLDLHSLRSEETRGLKYKEVIEDNGKCYINIVRTRTVVRGKDTVQEVTKTDGSTRKVLIDRRLYDLIHSQPHKTEDDYVINISYSVYAENIQKVISCNRVNGHPTNWITPHTLRHIFKTEHIGNPVAIAVGGWTVEGGVSERVYTHVKQKDKDELMSAYSKSLLDAYEHISEPNITISSLAESSTEQVG